MISWRIFGFSVVLTTLLLHYSCRKDHLDLVWEKLPTGTTDDLMSMVISPEGEVWVAGGKSWFSGVVLHSQDAGSSLNIVHQTNKALLSICLDNQRVVTTGVDGHIWTFHESTGWSYSHPNYWSLARGISIFPNGRNIIVGGNAFESGFMFTIDPPQGTNHLNEHLNRINAIAVLDSVTAQCVGYGVVYRSIDSGNSWQIQDIAGDHYMAIHFPERETGFIAGYGGSLLKSTDGGINWVQLQAGPSPLSSGPAFRTIFFMDAQTGIVAGDEGIAWLTRNSGEDWYVLQGLPKDIDFLAAGIRDGHILLAGTGGAFYRASIP